MNKRKVAVFVEGQTELVFVREMLARWFEYDANVIGFDCYNLLNNSFHDTSYTLGSDQSENYFMLVNVGNDNSVLSKIKARMQQLVSLNYHVVIGLRDMYSAQYIKDAKEHVIKEEVNKLHIKSAQEQIAEIRDGERISFHFAIMEVEAWLLGMHQYLKSIDERLESDYILEKIGINLQEDPETTVFHPARRLDDIYALVDKHYHKHESDIETIMAALKVEDFKGLIRSGKCNSFKTFTESLLGESGAFFD